MDEAPHAFIDRAAMRIAASLVAVLASTLGLAPHASAAIESHALGAAEAVPVAIQQVFRCGAWAEAGRHGHYRLVLATVNGGAGTEVYIQRILESTEGSDEVLHVVATIPVRELNNDHQQYQVSSARCSGSNSVELMATYEHDEGDVERRIRLVLAAAGTYRIRNVVVPGAKRRR